MNPIHVSNIAIPTVHDHRATFGNDFFSPPPSDSIQKRRRQKIRTEQFWHAMKNDWRAFAKIRPNIVGYHVHFKLARTREIIRKRKISGVHTTRSEEHTSEL